ncbi:MAG TPA: hypothetical protein VGO57_18455 [Verrucomicrobiae bacterium]|jgi:hypothetical protein
MAIHIKSKFAGLLRSLWGNNGHAESSEPIRPLAAAQQQPPAPSAALAPGYNYASQPSVMPAGDVISLPLAAVVNTLPMDLKARVAALPPAGMMIHLPTETVVAQLAFGAVKITFGELRQLVPGAFGDSNLYDSRPVNLPLNEILTRINPAQLTRRSTHKVEVSEEIAGPFGAQARGISFTAQPLKPVAPAAPASLPPRETAPPATISFNPLSTPPAVKSEPIAFTPRQTTPAAAPVSTPIPFAEPPKPAKENAVLPAFKFATAPTMPAPGTPVEAQSPLVILLRNLAESWPDEIKGAIVQNGWINMSVALPVALIEPGLKRGRVTMTWRELRALFQPNALPSIHDDLSLELPLKTLAPAFLMAQKTRSASQPRVAVSSEIPNLFFGFPQAAVEPVAPAPAPVLPRPAELAAADTNLFSARAVGATADEQNLFQRTPLPATDFLSRQMPPKEVVASAMALPGVAGAVVGLADGLRVAATVPADVNADAVAAFLPQIFDRVNQSTRELRMGALNNVGFTVGNVPWKIFRINSVYFAAFGRAGEALPAAPLALLAAGLDRKQK